jgi:hypothetical protein
MPSSYDPALDELLWGARAIAIAANIKDADGEPNVKKAFRLLSGGVLPAVKRGRRYVSTRRQLLGIASSQSQQDPSK